MFKEADTNRNGTIQLDELQNVLNALEVKIDPSTLSKLFKEIDLNGNGKIEEQEFY